MQHESGPVGRHATLGALTPPPVDVDLHHFSTPGVARRVACQVARHEFSGVRVSRAMVNRWHREAFRAEGLSVREGILEATARQAAAMRRWVATYGRDWSVGSWNPPAEPARTERRPAGHEPGERGGTGRVVESESEGGGGDIPPPSSPPLRLHLDRRAGDLAERVAAAPSDTLLSRTLLAAWLGVAPKTIARWDRSQVGPRRVRAGLRAVRYRKGDVLAWLEECEAASARRAPR